MSNSPEQTTGFSDRLTGRGILRTLFMPEIKLGFRSTGMVHRSFLSILATMFIQSGLLPYNHPARYADGAGKYGFRGILGEAWHNMRHRGGDLQQWGLFISVFLLFAFAIMAVLTLGAKVLISTANASNSVPGGLFSAPNPDTDLGLMMIERLIGAASRGEGEPYGAAIGDLLQMYSYGVLVIASFIVAWSILSIVVDTAATGRFFGGRHNPVWWPIRLVFALGILIPLAHGFSAGQYMVIQIAKWGSGLASNAWSVYVTAVLQGSGQQYLAKQFPADQVVADMNSITKMYLCMYANNRDLNNRNVFDQLKMVEVLPGYGPKVGAGSFALGKKKDYDYCGKVIFPTDYMVTGGNIGSLTENDSDYSDLMNLVFLGQGAGQGSAPLLSIVNKQREGYNSFQILADRVARKFVASRDPADEDDWDRPVDEDMGEYYNFFEAYYTDLKATMDEVVAEGSAPITNEIDKFGWPGAAMWYYLLSSSNSKMGSIASLTPQVHVASSVPASSKGWFSGWFTSDEEEAREDLERGQKYFDSFDQWWNDEVSEYMVTHGNNVNEDWGETFLRVVDTQSSTDASKEEAKGMLSSFQDMLGIKTLFDLLFKRIGEKGFSGSSQLHPIVLMIEIGNGLLNMAFMLFSASLVLFQIGIGASWLPFTNDLGLAALSSIEFVMGLVYVIMAPMIVAGAIIAIILPMIPFIRFLFAISTWLIAILEAVVMVPIIAIGHLRTDGEGLIGPTLQGAYGILLQLLLRPVLIVIGLVLSMALVEVTVGYVNTMFYSVVMHLPDQGWVTHLISLVTYTVMYGALMYTLINSSFKLVDLFPDSVVKYLGTGATGGLNDSEDGEFRSAILAGAVFASKISPPSLSRQKEKAADKEKPGADEDKGSNKNKETSNSRANEKHTARDVPDPEDKK